MTVQKEILPKVQQVLFDTLSAKEWVHPFYLARGTALALQIGHRQSIDFDFFGGENIDTDKILRQLRKIGRVELFDRLDDTLNCAVDDVQLSFFSYEYPTLGDFHGYGNIRIASVLDIALMKLEAISGRGSKKDFIDLFFSLKRFSMSELFTHYPEKFGIDITNHYHLLKSLVYFEDAENQPMPLMLKPVCWEEVKKSIVSQVHREQIKN